MKIDIFKPVRFLKGVGPRRAELLGRLGISTIADILLHYPRRYEDRSNIRPISAISEGAAETIEAKVVGVGRWRSRKGQFIFQLRVDDGTEKLSIVYFNQPYILNYLKKGTRAIFYGRVERYKGLKMANPEFEVLKDEEAGFIHAGRIVPIYPLTEGIGQRWLRNIVYSAVDRYCPYLSEHLPTSIRARNRLLGYRDAVRNIHFPKSTYLMKEARRRLAFDEFLMMQLYIGLKRHRIKERTPGVRHKIKKDFIDSFIDTLPFGLTEGQSKAIKEVSRDMASPKPMARLLQGDVASGKTVVAAYAMALSAHNGMQAAMMAPTEVLANQHYLTVSQLLSPLGFEVELLTGSIKEKDPIYRKIAGGAADIVIGTHALITDAVGFRNLGLVVIDEEHKFGVIQRDALCPKEGKRPDVLIMTATPIPRTLALTIYGELDISALSEMPKGRGSVMTYWFGSSRRPEIYDFIRREIRKGRQAFFVFPLIERSKRADIAGAEEVYRHLECDVFGEFSVRLLHGRMSKRQQDAAMKAFRDKGADILVATTIVEVGIDVPNATVMVIENAERFGLAQLHQLRGRIARSKERSYCILISDAKMREQEERMDAMVSSTDGFYISQRDLEIRGPGRLLGRSQHGFGEFQLADLTSGLDMLKKARSEAFRLIASDPALAGEEHRNLREILKRRFPPPLFKQGAGQ